MGVLDPASGAVVIDDLFRAGQKGRSRWAGIIAKFAALARPCNNTFSDPGSPMSGFLDILYVFDFK